MATIHEKNDMHIEQQPKSTEELPLKKIVIIAIVLGIILNWLAMYLNITLGFLSIGISPFFALLIARMFLKRKEVTKKSLTLISISYGATRAAESAVGLLFLIWLYYNALPFFGLEFSAPWWLLPSPEVLNSKIIWSQEWIVPLLVHWFLMLIPGITGILFGYFLAPRFIHNDKEYPFPGTIQVIHQMDVLVTNNRDKTKTFSRFLLIGFLLAAVTLLYPFLDVSSPTNGWIFGIALGTIGLALFSIGFIIRDPKITIVVGISSVLMYTILSPFIVKNAYLEALAAGEVADSFYDFFTFALQHSFLSFLIGFMLAGMIAGPFLANIIKGIFKKDKTEEQTELGEKTTDSNSSEPLKTEIESKAENSLFNNNLFSFQRIFVSTLFLVVILACYFFITTLNIFPDVPWWLILLVLIWILVIGIIVQGYMGAKSLAKAGTVALPPFIFDAAPIFLTGVQGWTPYLATPRGEVDGTLGVVRSMKLGSINNVKKKHVMLGYMAGYIAATLTTPFFALLLWQALGIGTTQLPAPAFPIQGAFIAPFALRTFEGFISIGEAALGGILGLFFGSISGTIALAAAIGLLFPPHMALMITLGGILRLLVERKYGKERTQDEGNFRATAFSVGATLSVPILIILTVIL
jgi:hypothetical protein